MTKQYTIGGRAFTQGPLTLSRLQRLTRLAADAGFESLATQSPSAAIGSLIDSLTSAELPAEFFRTILDGPVDDMEWGDVDANDLVEVLEDFFGFNSRIVQKLTGTLRGLLPSPMPASMN